MLSSDVVLYTDGGGKATAVLDPIRGAVNVVRFVMRATNKSLPADLARQFAEINGQPGVIT